MSKPLTEKEVKELGYEPLKGQVWRNKDGTPAVFRDGRLVTAGVASAEDLALIKDAVQGSGNGKGGKGQVSLNKLPPSDYHETRALVEKKDEELIDAEMRGEVLEEFVYNFKKGGRDVVGLTYAGIRELAKREGRISVEDVKVTETETHYRVISFAKNLDSQVQMAGVAEQPKVMELSSGKKIPDEFALQKCVSKSQRNALRALVNEASAIVALKDWLQGSKDQRK